MGLGRTRPPREEVMGCGGSKPANDVDDVKIRFNGASGPDIMLLKVADLLNNKLLTSAHLRSCDIMDQHWRAKKSIGELFDSESFVTIPWEQLKSTKYAVMTYCWGYRPKGVWGAPWSHMIDALQKRGGMNVEYVWIDIFCLNQLDPKKMETVDRSGKIYAWASEYHVMGFSCLTRGWCQMELGTAKAPPLFYSAWDGLHEKVGQIIKIINPSEVLDVYDHGGGDDDEDFEAPEVQSMMFSSTGLFKQAMPDPKDQLKKLLGFAASGFTNESDRSTVRGIIEGEHGSVERFEEFLVDKVSNDNNLKETAAGRRA